MPRPSFSAMDLFRSIFALSLVPLFKSGLIFGFAAGDRGVGS